MAADSNLPTRDVIEHHALRHLDAARSEMSEVRDWLRSAEVRDWLRSDWSPLGSPLTGPEADARSEVLRIVGQVKDLIDQAKGMLHG